MQFNKIKEVGPFVKLITAISLFAIGICFIILPNNVCIVAVTLIAACALVLEGTYKFASALTNGNLIEALIQVSIYIILAAVLLAFRSFFADAFAIVVAVFCIVLAILRLFITIHLINVGGPGIVRNIISIILCVAFAIIIFTARFLSVGLVEIVCGVYFILFGVSNLEEGISQMTKKYMKGNKKRNTFFSLPNVITAGVSTGIINKYDKIVDEDENITEIVDYKDPSDLSKVNFHILIHVSHNILSRMGHVDISLGDSVYSFGNYDSSKNKLGGMISQGSFMVVPFNRYMKLCLTDQRKYVIDYGCILTDDQLSAVQERIDEIFETTTLVDFDDPTIDIENNIGASQIRDIKGKLYKVNSGPFKTYFAISSNCVQLADTIIGRAGLDNLSSNSIRTPGAYYKMMESQFHRKHTRVVSRIAYLQVEPGAKKKLDEQIKKAKEKNKKKNND